MIRRRIPPGAVLMPALLLPFATAQGADLAIVKAMTVVADQVNTANPKALPGSSLDYAITVTNPLGNGLAPVRNEVIADVIPARLALRVADYGAAGSGPVEFADGNLLGTGLLATGLTYNFVSLASATDAVDFSSDGGATWTYVPTADAGGYDARVNAIRVRLTGTHSAGTSFRLRFRTRIR